MQEEITPSEALVLSVIHELGRADIYEILERVNHSKDKDWKFQTVNTLCLRLEAKNFLVRGKAGRRVIYSPKGTRDHFFESIVKKFFGSSLMRDPNPLISYLAKSDKLDDRDKELLNGILKKIKGPE